MIPRERKSISLITHPQMPTCLLEVYQSFLPVMKVTTLCSLFNLLLIITGLHKLLPPPLSAMETPPAGSSPERPHICCSPLTLLKQLFAPQDLQWCSYFSSLGLIMPLGDVPGLDGTIQLYFFQWQLILNTAQNGEAGLPKILAVLKIGPQMLRIQLWAWSILCSTIRI